MGGDLYICGWEGALVGGRAAGGGSLGVEGVDAVEEVVGRGGNLPSPELGTLVGGGVGAAWVVPGVLPAPFRLEGHSLGLSRGRPGCPHQDWAPGRQERPAPAALGSTCRKGAGAFGP